MPEKPLHVDVDMNAFLKAAVDHVPDSQMKLWLNQVHCGDCVEVMNKMPAKSVGVVVTSPPYNLRNSTGNGMKDGRGGKWENAALVNGYDNHDDDMPYDEYVTW